MNYMYRLTRMFAIKAMSPLDNKTIKNIPQFIASPFFKSPYTYIFSCLMVTLMHMNGKYVLIEYSLCLHMFEIHSKFLQKKQRIYERSECEFSKLPYNV